MNAASKLVLVLGFVASAAAALAAPPAAPAPRSEDAEKKTTNSKPITVPFELLRSRHMAVNVKLNGKGPYRLIFDTGAPTNLVNNKLAKEAGIVTKDDKPAFGLFGMMGAKSIDTLEIGDVKLNKVPVMVMDHPTVAAISNALGPIDGIVGFPFFARFKITIDYQKKELTLEENGYKPGDAMQALMNKMMAASGAKPEPAIVAPAALWGFVADKGDKDENAGVTIKEVLAGSPAEKGGLKKGDRLLTLDGRWTDSLADALIAASVVRPGRAATLVVERDGKEVKLTVTPAKGF